MASCARPATAKKSVPMDRLMTWYKQRVVGWPDNPKPKSENDDMKDRAGRLSAIES